MIQDLEHTLHTVLHDWQDAERATLRMLPAWSISDKDRHALQYWVRGGYEEVNPYLRGILCRLAMVYWAREAGLNHLEELDNLPRVVTEHAITVYRGLTVPTGSIKTGLWHDRGYQSCTLRKMIAEHAQARFQCLYRDGHVDQKSYIATLHIPVNTPILPLVLGVDSVIAQNEAEILVGPEIAWDVTNIGENTFTATAVCLDLAKQQTARAWAQNKAQGFV